MVILNIFSVISMLFLTGALSEDIQTSSCEHTSLSMQCHPGQILHIVEAKFGRDTHFKCGFGFNKKCQSHLALVRTRTLCEGREICSIPVEAVVFGDDPCPRTSKYLDVQYRCVETPKIRKCLPNELKCADGQCIDNARVCDGNRDCADGDDEDRCNYRTFIGCSDLYIECSNGEVIYILEGQYGRSSSTICKFDIGHYCSAKNATDIIKQKCNMNRNCYIQRFNDIFGDPCPHTSKYIEVTYACRKSAYAAAEDATGTYNPTGNKAVPTVNKDEPTINDSAEDSPTEEKNANDDNLLANDFVRLSQL